MFHRDSLLGLLLRKLHQFRDLIILHVLVFICQVPKSRLDDRLPLLSLDGSWMTDDSTFDALHLLGQESYGDGSTSTVSRFSWVGSKSYPTVPMCLIFCLSLISARICTLIQVMCPLYLLGSRVGEQIQDGNQIRKASKIRPSGQDSSVPLG